MIIRFLIVITLSLSILAGIHFFLLNSFFKFFSITDYRTKLIAIAIIALLSISFIITSILAHWLKSSVTGALYLASSIWIGLMANLLIFATIGWLIIYASGILNFNIGPKPIGITLFALATIISVYGIINANNIKTTQITVPIKNLPEFWKGKNIVQISDTHLGVIRDEKFFKNIVDRTNELHPTMVVITGDLFDGVYINLETFKPLIEEIKAPQGVYFVTGNHEVYMGVEKIYNLLEKTHIKAISDESIDVSGLQLLGINYPATGEKQNIISIIKSDPNFIQGKPTILLHHTPSNINQAKELDVNLQLSGHTHKFQIFPFQYLTKIIFKKYAYGFYKEGDFSIYTSVGAGTWGPPMRTGHRPEIVNITLQ